MAVTSFSGAVSLTATQPSFPALTKACTFVPFEHTHPETMKSWHHYLVHMLTLKSASHDN